jgi:hypothetical protein
MHERALQSFSSSDRRPIIYRLLEIMPGFFLWTTLIGSIALSFIKPIWAIYFIIAFDLYWLLRVTYFVFFLILAWTEFRKTVAIDWHARLVRDFPAAADVTHIIFLPTAGEPLGVIERTLEALRDCAYDSKRFIVVLAGEERFEEQFNVIAREVHSQFAQYFQDFLVSVHPMGLADEIPGKGSNTYYAGHEVKKYVDKEGIDYDSIIVSTFDVDTIVHPQYFAHLTHVYFTQPDRLRCSYQPVALYNNNMWESHPIIRVASFGTTFWLFSELARPERLFTFSSHSMPWRALVDVGFWDKKIVSEDSRIFLQCFIRYEGQYRVQPLFIPVSMNTVMVPSLWRSFVNLYKQQRRWAWGVENFPYMIWNFFLRKNKIPMRKKLYYLVNMGEGYFTWATAPLLIFILGFLPLYIAGQSVQATAIYQTAPFVLQNLLRLSMAGILVSAVVSIFLLPPWPHMKKLWQRAMTLVILLGQWVLLIVTLVIFGAFPSIESQTRLMIGKRLGFWVTEKK